MKTLGNITLIVILSALGCGIFDSDDDEVFEGRLSFGFEVSAFKLLLKNRTRMTRMTQIFADKLKNIAKKICVNPPKGQAASSVLSVCHLNDLGY